MSAPRSASLGEGQVTCRTYGATPPPADQLEVHEHAEEELLIDYRQAAEKSSDRAIRFLTGLILEDEERHHRLMAAMARDVKSSVLWLGDQPPLPSVAATFDDRAELIAPNERFLEIEEDSVGQLKELKKAVKQLRAGLLELLVDGMEADTHKHIDILKYIHKQLELKE